MFPIIALYALLAFAFMLAKIAVEFAHPIFLIGVRMITAGLLLCVYYFVFSKHSNKPLTRKHIKLIGAVALFHIYLAFLPEFWALQYLTSIKVNSMYATTPFISALIGFLLYKERLGKIQFAGMIIAFIGMLPVILGSNLDDFYLPAIASISWPEIMLMLAITSAAYAWFLIKDLMRDGYSLIYINGMSMLLGGIASILTWGFMVALGFADSMPVVAWQSFLISTAALILVSNIIVYNLYAWLVHHYSITLIALAGFMCPIFGALYGTLFLQETFTWHYLVAIIGITLGLYLFTRNNKKTEITAEII